MHAHRVVVITTLASLASWTVSEARAQNAIKLFQAAPITQSGPCAGASCDPVRDRVEFDAAMLMLSCKARPTGILSSTPDGLGPLVIDNFVEVNGTNVCTGGLHDAGVESCFNLPVVGGIGTPALNGYQSVPPIDISGHLPRKAIGMLLVNLVDFGGIYANSDVWLVTNCTAPRRVDICHKPGTKAEQVIRVSQAAVSGHLWHGDTMDLTTCRPPRGRVR